jgi:hypothetical protein
VIYFTQFQHNGILTPVIHRSHHQLTTTSSAHHGTALTQHEQYSDICKIMYGHTENQNSICFGTVVFRLVSRNKKVLFVSVFLTCTVWKQLKDAAQAAASHTPLSTGRYLTNPSRCSTSSRRLDISRDSIDFRIKIIEVP